MGPERPREVSLASTTRPCARSSGMGVWGAQPPADEERDRMREGPPLEAALRPRSFRGRAGVPPHPRPLSPGRGSRTASRRPAGDPGRGRGGGAPNRKKIRGRVGGPRAALRGIPRVHDTTVRTLLRDGAWGAQPLADEGEGQTVRWFRPRGGAAPPRLSRARGSLPLTPPLPRERGQDRPGGSGAQAGRSFRSSEHQQGSGFRTKRGPPHGGPHAWFAKRRNAQGVRTGSCSSSAGGSGSGALAIFSAVTSPST